MADVYVLLSVVAALLLSLTDVEAGSTCHYRATQYFPYRSYTFYKYCQYGCCSKGCCTSAQIGLSVGVIIGCVVGVISLIAIIVGVICCCRRRRAQPGQVMRSPGNQPFNPGVAVIQQGTHTSSSSQPQYQYNMQPMGGTTAPNTNYMPYMQPPPAYPGYSNPTYPPTSNPDSTPTYPPTSNEGGNTGYTSLASCTAAGKDNSGYTDPSCPPMSNESGNTGYASLTHPTAAGQDNSGYTGLHYSDSSQPGGTAAGATGGQSQPPAPGFKT